MVPQKKRSPGRDRLLLTQLHGGGRLEIIGGTPVMQALFRDLETVGCSDAAVLVEGETGVGKNLIARALHHMGPRASKPFISISAANLTDQLFESELFGHVRGAFTGAYGDHKGLARAADKGTLFIDEIGELSFSTQAKLLCFLDQREVRPVGGLRASQVDVRVICATNRDLRESVREGSFRRDLYYRLRVIAVKVPSLRDRREDLPALVDFFIQRFNRHYGKSVTGISSEALAVMLAHDWEGNIRELENEVERAVVLSGDNARLEAAALSIEPDLEAHAAVARDGVSMLRESRHAAERRIIHQGLKRHRWNVTAAARELGISRVGLTRKLKRLGLRRPGTEESDPSK